MPTGHDRFLQHSELLTALEKSLKNKFWEELIAYLP
jgi:hypothetical protein